MSLIIHGCQLIDIILIWIFKAGYHANPGTKKLSKIKPIYFKNKLVELINTLASDNASL